MLSLLLAGSRLGLGGGKLLKALGPTVAGLAADTAITGIGTRAASEFIPGAREFMGLDVDSIAAGENYDLNNPDSYKNDPGDRLRSLLSGVSLDKVEEKAKQNAIDKVNKELQPTLNYLKAGYKGLPEALRPDLNDLLYKEGQNTGEAKLRAEDALRTYRAQQTALANEVPIENLIGLNNAALIQGAQRAYGKQEAETLRKKLKQEAATERDERRNYEREIRGDKLSLELAKLRADRAAADARNQIQLQQIINQNNRLDRQEARQARKDQQNLYLMLVQGLQNGLGQLQF